MLNRELCHVPFLLCNRRRSPSASIRSPGIFGVCSYCRCHSAPWFFGSSSEIVAASMRCMLKPHPVSRVLRAGLELLGQCSCAGPQLHVIAVCWPTSLLCLSPVLPGAPHRMVRVGRGLPRPSAPTCCSRGAIQSRLPRTVSRRLLEIPKEGDSAASLGNPRTPSVCPQPSPGWPPRLQIALLLVLVLCSPVLFAFLLTQM